MYAKQDLSFSPHPVSDIRGEQERFRTAAKAAASELAVLTKKARGGMGDELAHIFRSQQTMAEDESTLDEICGTIREKAVCAEKALFDVFNAYREMFSQLPDDDYNKARLADIDDVYKRILRNLLGLPETDLSELPPDTIVVAEELFPSDTALMDPSKVIGLITEKGGVTSHVAIVAKNLGIPAAVSLPDAARRISSGDTVALDATGNEAAVHVNPGDEERKNLEAVRAAYLARQRRIATVRGLPPETPDGRRITLSANIGSDSEARSARDKGATSVGLFRSEFLFIGQTKLPDEEEQFRAYKAAVEIFKDGFVIVRTLDVGGDKKVPSLSIPQEENPFLGYRALRISLDRSDVFKPQLRAILRASHYGKMKMMFPMVSGVSEVKAALVVLDECRNELRAEKVPFDENMEVGVMIEIPSAVFVAPELAQIVDFFSVGTNDLTQYLLAADRMNARVQSYYRALDPAVFRALKAIVDAAHAKGKWVGICGELGGNPLAIPVLLGMGVDELSMSPQSLYEAIYTVRAVTYEKAKELADQVFSLDCQEAIATILSSSVMREE